jgi:hypothetical protein
VGQPLLNSPAVIHALARTSVHENSGISGRSQLDVLFSWEYPQGRSQLQHLNERRFISIASWPIRLAGEIYKRLGPIAIAVTFNKKWRRWHDLSPLAGSDLLIGFLLCLGLMHEVAQRKGQVGQDAKQ